MPLQSLLSSDEEEDAAAISSPSSMKRFRASNIKTGMTKDSVTIVCA